MSVLPHPEDLQKLCRICCQFLGKGIAKKNINIEHIFLINTKHDSPSLHTDKIYQKCHCVMSFSVKRKSTVATAVFKRWIEYSVQHSVTFVTEFNFSIKGYLEPKNLAPTKLAKAYERQKQRTPSGHKVSLIPLLYK